MNDLLDQFDLRRLYLVAGSVVLLVVTAVVMFAGKPLYARYDATDTELDGLRALARTPSKLGIQPLEAEVASLEDELQGDLQNLPIKQLESHIVTALQSASWQYDVNLVTIEPRMEDLEFAYQELTFQLQLEGSYFGLDNWMQSVSDQLGYVVFKEYSLKVKEPGLEPVLSARVLLSAYRMDGAHD